MTQGVYYRSPEMLRKLQERARNLPRKKAHSPESIEKMRKARLGTKRQFTPEWIENLRKASIKAGCTPPRNDMRGYKHTSKSRINMSLGQSRGGRWKGNMNPKWRGGVSSENRIARSSAEYKNWRRNVFERDGYKCVIGGKEHGNKLQADHIQSFALYPELRYEVNNGRTLCEKCHRATPNYAGRFYKN
jgi:hypothetical protein